MRKLGSMIEQLKLSLYWARYTWASYADKIGIEGKKSFPNLSDTQILVLQVNTIYHTIGNAQIRQIER